MNRRKALIVPSAFCVFIMLWKAFQQAPFVPCKWNSVMLSFSYRYGFIQRGFLGTIIDVLSDIFPISSYMILKLFQYFTMMMFFLVISVIVVWSIDKWNNNKKVYFVIAMGYVMGSGYTTWFSEDLFGHSDVWLIILTIIALWAILKDNYEVAVLISVICMLIHQAYIFMYFNAILLALAIKFVYDDSKRKRIILNLFLLIVSCSLLFIYLQFFSGVKPGIDYEYVRERSISILGDSYIDSWEAETKNYWFHGKTPYPFTQGLQQSGKWAIYEIVFMIPMIIEIGKYWRVILSNTKDKIKKCIYFATPLGIITTLPLFVMHCDYGRWFHALYFYEAIAIWLVNLISDEGVKKANKEMISWVKNNICYYVILLYYWISLGSFHRNYLRSAWPNLENNILHYWHLFMD